MDELGSILRDAREMKGLTLEEAQKSTRINARFLEAMEQGEYYLLPTPVHVRGFLRNYARFLDLDPDPLLERYEASQSHQPLPAATQEAISPDSPLTPREDQPFFKPVNMSLDGTADQAESRMRLVIIVALLITIGLAASRFVPLLLGRGDGQDNLPGMIEAIMAGEEATVEATPKSNVPLVTSEPINPTERNNPGAVATQDAAPPTRPPLPPTMERIHLRLDITERTWVRVSIDDEIVLEDEVTRDEGPFEWDADEAAHLLTGNAAGVVVTINDVPLGRLGSRGQVYEETWTTTGN
ncbi:MAG TPA: RodZ domain-containing protein [Candidatus Binatia bacterium]|nr:RodZ domain-containing protein [Candidatus Binatia bacterium]